MSGSITRAECDRRIAEVDADPEQTVWITKHDANGATRMYHADDCHNAPPKDECKQVTRRYAHRRGCPPCQMCLGDHEVSHAGGYDTKECSACGETYKILADHLRKCEKR